MRNDVAKWRRMSDARSGATYDGTLLMPGPEPDIWESSIGNISSRWNRMARWINVCPTSYAEFRLRSATSVLVRERPGLPPQAMYASTAPKLFSTTPMSKVMNYGNESPTYKRRLPIHAFSHCQSAWRLSCRIRRSCSESQLFVESELPSW